MQCMNDQRNLFLLFIVACFAILMKIGYTFWGIHELNFLLRPVANVVGLTTGSSVVHLPDKGYLLPQAGILIDRSCSGMHFWIICFVVLMMPVLKHRFSTGKRFIFLFGTLAVSYVLTIFANSARIRFAVFSQQAGDLLLGVRPHHRIHEASGVLVYLFFLILFYLAVDYLLNKYSTHENTTAPGMDLPGK
jgi:exosortase K